MIRQRTINNMIRATGVGVHTGSRVELTLRPAPDNTGIVFSRIDLDPIISIRAYAKNVGSTSLSTSLEKNGVKISTIEHLTSACAGLGIDNLYVDVSSNELPIMDGSAAPFVFLMQSAGIKIQEAPKKFIRIKKKVKVKHKDKWAVLEPYEGFQVNFTIDFNHPVFNSVPNHVSLDFSTVSYVKQISRARTFGFVADLEKMQAMSLALGASMANSVAIDDFRILNEDGLRYGDEFVKHKALDAIGDLYLLGSSLIGKFTGYKSGHALNNELIRKLLDAQSAWEYVTFEDEETLPIAFSQPILAYA
ncbi:MAG: UDP-3-O-acyl-N-acetylglucosamine deacetylase [Gammaproteobacteria bacterium]|nr:UDP-3-O-acyl-N-acetylglucosamine deacetylase [Gammaproteobacteria bacterium]